MLQPVEKSRPCGTRWGALSIVVVLLVLAPFATTLGIHHDLAAADHDGHQHSDADLCQWVQDHVGSSLVGEVPAIAVVLAPAQPPVRLFSLPFSTQLTSLISSRAPPTF